MIGKFPEQFRTHFADRFSASGAGYIYRRTKDSKSVIISAKDHAFLIDDFDRRLTAFASVTIGFIVVAIIVAIGVALGDFPGKAMLIFLTVAFPAVLWLDLWDTSEIAFYQRLVDKGEHRKIPFLNREVLGRSWSSILATALLCLFLAGQHSSGDVLGLWDRIMIVVFFLGIIYLASIAVVKALSYGGSRHTHLYQRN